MSRAASKYALVAGDKYFTPTWVTQALLSVESFTGKVIDPAAGAGHILDALTAAGIENDGFDLVPDAIHVRGPLDFLTAEGAVPNIVTNPPYGVQSRLAVRFIDKALAVTQPLGGKVAMLLKVGFDTGSTRRRLFKDHPAFAANYVLTRRIHWANIPLKYDADGRLIGPTENHMWCVWDWRKRPGTPSIVDYPEMETADA